MYYVYVLQSRRDGNFYIGQTNNLEKRIKEHFNGEVLSTKTRRPFKVVGYKTYETRSDSMWVEHSLKKHGDQKKKFIDNLLRNRPPARRAYGPEGGEGNEI